MNSDSRETKTPPALVIDLDGTLIRCNSFHRELLSVLRTGRLANFLLELIRTKAWTKSRIKLAVAKSCPALDFSQCFATEVLTLVVEGRRQGIPLLLATGASELSAERIVAQLDFDIPFISSTEATNLTGRNKARALVAMFGEQKFNYVGDSKADFEVFAHSKQGVLIGRDVRLSSQARKRFPNLTILWSAGRCRH